MPRPWRVRLWARRADCSERRSRVNRHFTLVGRLVCLLGLASGLALAQSPPPERPSPGVWADGEFRWYYNPRSQPAWLDPDSARELVTAAAERWAACGVRMTLLGDTDRSPGLMDRQNVVGWSMEMPRQLRAITLGRARDGRLLERDIALRPDRKEFERFPRLLQKVITHEFGHAIGLTHSERCHDVMTLAADCPRAHPNSLPIDLTANDLARCHALYPASATADQRGTDGK